MSHYNNSEGYENTTTEIKLYETAHPYYCEEGGYYYRIPDEGWGAECHYNSIQEYLDDWSGADGDMNFIFRWDWEYFTPEEYKEEYHDNFDTNRRQANNQGDYSVITIFYMMQRKGCKKIIKIFGAEKEDEPALKKHLKKHWECMRKTWEGVS
jgi:hypothetical protein